MKTVFGNEKGTTLLGREPALWAGLATAAMYALTEFGVDLTRGQQAAVMGVVIALLSFFVRQQVEPVSVESSWRGDDDFPGREDDQPDIL